MSPLPSSPLRLEIRKMFALGVPVAATQLSTMLLGFVDTVMVGRVSVEALGAAALANVWIFGTLLFASGVLFGLDPIVAQAHGARDGARAGRALQTGVVMALLLSVLVSILWTQTELFLLVAGQDPELARMAHDYTVVQIPGIPFFLIYTALRQYLQGREHMRPALWVILVANVFNVLFNWALIFGHLGFPALGLVGAGIATTATRLLSCVGLVLFVRILGLHHGAWVPWSRASWSARKLRELTSLGLPVAIQMGLEMWAFSAAALLAGLLGPLPLAAHTVAINMAALSFMLPLGISQGAATRVGNLIGARDPSGAQRAAWVSLAMGAGIMCVSAVIFVVFRAWLPRIYTPDTGVIAAAAAILPIAAAFQIFDGTQVVGCGILRGMGRVRPAMVFNLVSYWLLGLPIGAWLGLRLGWGLVGIWWGLCIGLGLVATLIVGFVARRGPGSTLPGVLAASLVALGLGGCSQAEATRRHLLLVTVDTLRADHLGSYGSDRGLTPALDALAARSQRFSAVYAPAPITLPSVGALLTGRDPDAIGLASNLGILPDGVPTLATELQRQGWRTGAVVSSFVLRERTGLAAGFDRYDVELPQIETTRQTPERTAGATTDAAIAQLDALLTGEDRGAAPIFLWVHYQDPHGPYTPPEPLRERYLAEEQAAPGGPRQLELATNWRGAGLLPSYQYVAPHREVAYYRAGYAGEVAFLDRGVGRLLEALDKRGVRERGVIVFTADHGESLGEDDYWFAHGERLTDPSMRVPLLIEVPGRPGARHEATASLVDVVPTVAALLGVKFAGLGVEIGGPGGGVDLLAEAPGPARSVYLRTLHGSAPPRTAIVRDGYKLIRTERDDGVVEALFRLPDEARDLAAADPERARTLREALVTHFRGRGPVASEEDVSPAERASLRAMGYLAE